MKRIKAAFVLLCFSFSALGDSTCRPMLFTAGDIKDELKNTNSLRVGNITLDKRNKRCTRRVTVIMPRLHVKTIDVANINSTTDVNARLKVFASGSLKAKSINMGNVQANGRVDVNRRINIGRARADKYSLGNTVNHSEKKRVAVRNSIAFKKLSSK